MTLVDLIKHLVGLLDDILVIGVAVAQKVLLMLDLAEQSLALLWAIAEHLHRHVDQLALLAGIFGVLGLLEQSGGTAFPIKAGRLVRAIPLGSLGVVAAMLFSTTTFRLLGIVTSRRFGAATHRLVGIIAAMVVSTAAIRLFGAIATMVIVT